MDKKEITKSVLSDMADFLDNFAGEKLKPSTKMVTVDVIKPVDKDEAEVDLNDKEHADDCDLDEVLDDAKDGEDMVEDALDETDDDAEETEKMSPKDWFKKNKLSNLKLD